MEQTIDAIAKAVGREAWEVRAENLVAASFMPYTNITNKHYDSGDYPAALLEAKEMIGLDAFRAGPRRDARARYLGVGFASYTEQSAHGTKVFAAEVGACGKRRSTRAPRVLQTRHGGYPIGSHGL